MIRQLADDPQSGFRKFALGLTVQSAVILLLAGPQWLAKQSSQADQPESAQTREILTILAPPPGVLKQIRSLSFRSGPRMRIQPGTTQRIDDGTSISFDADDSRQLIPVLAQVGGLIVFVPILDRTHPRSAFHPDGSPAPLPATLDHWVRIRLANASWWPEVEALCASADPNGTMEAMAVFPPSWRAALARELKSASRVKAITLHLEAGRPAGVTVRTVTTSHSGHLS